MGHLAMQLKTFHNMSFTPSYSFLIFIRLFIMRSTREKEMSRLFFVVFGLCLATIVGCGARGDVAKDKVLKKIDQLLGEMDVKMKVAENGVKEMEQKEQQIALNKNKMKAEIDQLNREIDPIKKDMDRAKSVLAEFKPHIAATEDVTINGKVYSPEKIAKSVTELADLYTKKESQLQGLEKGLETYQKTEQMLVKQQEVVSSKLADLQKTMEEIKTKKKSLEMMQTASKTASDASVIDKFDDLEKSVKDLYTDIDAASMYEEEKLDAALAKTSSVDDLLKEFETKEDLSAKVDAILGSGTEKKDEPKKEDPKSDDKKDDAKSDEASSDEAKSDEAKSEEAKDDAAAEEKKE